MFKQFYAAAFVLCASVSAAVADYEGSGRWFRSLAVEDRVILQFALMFTDDYVALSDGEFGRRTHDALTRFQSRNGLPTDGILNPAETELLFAQAGEFWDISGFKFVDDTATGVKIGVPEKLLARVGQTDRGSRWENWNNSAELETIRVPVTESSFEELYDRLTVQKATRQVTYSTIKSGFFIVSGVTRGKQFYTRFQRGVADSRGFSLAWDPEHELVFRSMSVAMSNSLSVNAALIPNATYDGAGTRTAAAPRQTPEVPKSVEGSGSGFFVTADGYVVTNNHVIDGCVSIEVAGVGVATLVRADPPNDLAVLRTTKRDATPVPLRLGSLRLGEDIVALGFPLGQMLADALTVTSGNVNSLSGLGGDTRYLRVSAAVQPGNSGGPLLDRSGALVGVVTARLDDAKTLEISGALPQNVNFASKATLLDGFLQSADVKPTYAGSAADQKSIADIADEAKKFTVQVRCHAQ